MRSPSVLTILAALSLSLSVGCRPTPPEAPRRDLDGYAGDEEVGPEEPPPEIPADAPLVIFLGDSISAGLHLPASAAFPVRLQALLAARGAPFRLVNAGISGDTSAGGLARLDWLLDQEPDVLVVELGANDGLLGQPHKTLERNLRAIVERTRARGIRVLVLGMRLPRNYGESFTENFAEIYTRVVPVSGDDVRLLPFFMEGVAGHEQFSLRDGLHPNAAGHRRLAENVAPMLEDWVRELRSAGDGERQGG